MKIKITGYDGKTICEYTTSRKALVHVMEGGNAKFVFGRYLPETGECTNAWVKTFDGDKEITKREGKLREALKLEVAFRECCRSGSARVTYMKGWVNLAEGSKQALQEEKDDVS